MCGNLILVGSEYDSNRLALKFIVGLMAFVATITFEAYCANLIAILLNTKVTLPFDSLDNLYHDTDYTIGYVGGTFIDELFKNGNEIMKKLYNERWMAFSDYEQLAKYAEKNRNFAMINEDDFMNGYYGIESCQFYAMDDVKITDVSIAMYAQKNSPFTNIINYE